jgi:hypothetical protein
MFFFLVLLHSAFVQIFLAIKLKKKLSALGLRVNRYPIEITIRSHSC